ncbi:MAG TPA: quinolinate synthase NadA [Syntrophorhabdaceae bacterium]|nr:quinolinate synthase NadA [Syntrophorhabdaceae bacterium]
MEKHELVDEILKLKKERNAVIVAHNYQIDDVQDIADTVGDSFALAKYCAEAAQDLIVFCGVRFMAESAKIISPKKTVLLPEPNAGCPLADMITAADVRALKLKYPGAAVVCYINTSADVKAECDICCTSSNAVKVIQSLKQKEIIFVPDKNLGTYISRQIPDKKLILWEGFCVTHQRVSSDEVKAVRTLHPDALVLVHPECRPEVVDLADFVGSTKQIIDFATASQHKKFVIGTEMGVLSRLKRDNPNKIFYLLSSGLVCPNMKRTKLQSVHHALTNLQFKIELDEDVRQKALGSLQKMLKVI